MPASAPSTEALPDPLLGAIMGLAGRSEGPSVTLVSKRWNAIFYAESSLWRNFTISPAPDPPARCIDGTGTARLHAKHLLLRRMGGLVAELKACNHGGNNSGETERWELAGSGAAGQPSLAQVLGLLQPIEMTRLVFQCNQSMPPQAAAALPRFSQLQALEFVDRYNMPPSLPPSLPATLARLPHLRALACHSTAALPTGLVEAIIQHLTQLTSLSLQSARPPPALQYLTVLTRLQHLVLGSPAYLQLGLDDASAPRLFPAPSSFPNLQTFDYGADTLVQVGGARLRCCSIRASDAGGVELSLDGVLTLPDLHQLLTALLPPGGTLAVRTLRLWPSRRMDAVAADPASWRSPLLAPLTSLVVIYAQVPPVPVLEALLAQATQLRSLHMRDCRLDVLPACVVGKAGLHELVIEGCGLADLPPGPYLSTLRTLSLVDNAFTRLPPVLAAATSLRELDISEFQGETCDLLLEDMDVLAGLAQLTKLELGDLYLNYQSTPSHKLRWVLALQRRLPQIPPWA